MNLKNLTAAEMVSISSAWVMPKNPARVALDGIPLVAAIVQRIETVHRTLVETQPASTAAAEAQISELATSVDAEHDNCARAIDLILNGFALCAPTQEKATEIHHLHDILLPDGLLVIRGSYRDEAGQADLLAKRLNDTSKAKLKKLPIPGGNVMDLVERWMTLAKELGQLENKRAALAQPSAKQTSAGDVVKARNEWIRTVNALVSMIELADVDDATANLLLGSLRDTERRAARRSSRRDAKEDPSGNSSETPPS